MAINRSITVDEVSIVDVFTRLIFDANSEFDETGRLVITLLRQSDSTIKNMSQRDIGELLRSMAIDEMITSVNQIKKTLDHQHGLLASSRIPSPKGVRH